MTFLALFTLLFFATLGSGAKAATPDTLIQSIDIPGGDLVESLERLAKQWGLELVFDADRLRGIHTGGAHGQMTAMQAVRELLKDTALTLVEHPDGAILVTPPSRGNASKDPSPGVAGSGEVLPSPNAGPGGATPDGALPRDANSLLAHESALKTIVVTGTHIPGETPVGSVLTVHSREEMEHSGSATLEQFGRDMPENYSSMDPIATLNANGGVGNFEQGAASNVFGGAGFNLKGLGPGSTLTLLNGHRLAAGGLDGSVVDISLIPLSAIDRIEVLDDGASAIYGSDAVAGVVNIITRREFEGAETGLRYGRATQGGAAEYTASQVVGHDWVTGTALMTYEYDDQQGLDASERRWIGPQGGPLSLVPANRRHSLYLTGRQVVGTDTTLSGDVLYSDRRFESDGIPLNTATFVDALQSSTGQVNQTTATVSVDQTLFEDWNATLTANYSRINQRDDSAALGASRVSTGGVGVSQLLADSDIRGVDVLANGALFGFSDNPIKASLGGSFRSEHFRSDESAGGASTLITQRRDVTSAFGELIIPLVDEPLPWLRRFVISGAFRYDHYEGFGDNTTPKVGWLWEPVEGLQFKGTAGESFKAPLLSQIGAPVTSYTALFPSGRGAGAPSDVLIINGGNGLLERYGLLVERYALLEPEKAKSITLGFDYNSTAVKGLFVSTNFFWLRLKDRIQIQNVLPEPILSQIPLQFITSENPGLADIQPFFDSPGFLGDFAGRGPAHVDFIVDNQFSNTTSTIEQGVNSTIRYNWPLNHGQVDVWLAGQYLFADRIRTASFEPETRVDNTIGEPPRFKARGGINWTGDSLLSDLTLNYVNSYDNAPFTPAQRIGSWTTADFYLGYSTVAEASPFLENFQIGLGVQNLTDKRPPYLQVPASYLGPGRNAIPFDGANASPIGRLISVQFKKRW